MSLSLASILAESASRFPGQVALVDGSDRLRYGELWEQAAQVGSLLRSLGVEPGDRVAILLPNTADFPRAYFGILALGAVVVPVHALLTPPEIAFVLTDCGAKVLLCAGPLAPAGEEAARTVGIPCISNLEGCRAFAPLERACVRRERDDAVILYTSGTTGKPKGAILTHNNAVLNATVTSQDLVEAQPGDVFFGALPLFHSFGQTCVMNAAFRAGASVALMARFEAAGALDLLVRERVTVFEGVPTMYIALLDAAKRDARRPPLRIALSGGAPLPVAVLEGFEAAFNVTIFEGYGLSETSPVASFNQKAFPRKAGTVGRGIWGIDLEVARADVDGRIELLPAGELGEIVIRGHCVFKGYLNNPDATREAIVDGWFRSGDLGTKDEDGFITIVDRRKDMILRGGFNVYPREVEEVLMRHPGVKQVAVVGVPDDLHGEEVVAFVVPREDAQRDGEAIIAWSKGLLAKHKYPRQVLFVEVMPLGPSGKVLKRTLRAQFTGTPAPT